MDDTVAVRRHYERCSEADRLTRSRVRRLEFETTLAVLHRHLRQEDVLLELGAGHGAYSLHFARHGHRVLATDIVPQYVAAILRRKDEERLATLAAKLADAESLRQLPEHSFNAVLCLGPYYHLKSRATRRLYLEQCRRVAHPGGFVALSYVGRLFAITYLASIGKAPTPDQYAGLYGGDEEAASYGDDFADVAHFSSPADVEREAEEAGFAVVEHVGTDGAFAFQPSVLEGLNEEQFVAYREHHLARCGETDHRHASGHGLVILRNRVS